MAIEVVVADNHTMKTVEQRFLEKVNKTDSCWLWTAGKSWDGYGKFSLNCQSKRAHIIAFQLFKGPIPNGKLVCHTHTGNRHCVNPEHLYAGTPKDNMQDCVKDGTWTNGNKNKTHCKRGHEFTNENTYLRKNNVRECKTCIKEGRKKYAR